jgi:hypothetical protein
MATLPHDLADLSLAPVVLAIDARIEELSHLSPKDLALHIGMEGDQPAWTREFRQRGLLATVSHLIDTHDWELSVDKRGIRFTHKERTFVLGVPHTFTEYLGNDDGAATSGAKS